MRTVVWLLVLTCAILHYDPWYWDDRSVVFGFMPVGLAYHAGLSVVSAIVWALAVRFAWPSKVEAWADQPASPETSAGAEPLS